MPSELLYKRAYAGKGQERETPEFMVRVNADAFKKWKASKIGVYLASQSFIVVKLYTVLEIDPKEVPLIDVVDAWEIFIAESHAHTGVLERPSHKQLKDAFGSHKFEDIFSFMAQHGHLRPTGKHATLNGEDRG